LINPDFYSTNQPDSRRSNVRYIGWPFSRFCTANVTITHPVHHHIYTHSIWLSTSLLIKQNDSPLQLPAAQKSPLTRLVPRREIVCYRRRDIAYYYGATWYRRWEHL